MTKLLLSSAFFSLLFLCAGTLFDPNNSIFWLAASDAQTQIMRTCIELIILSLLFSKPPRHVITRLVTSVVAIGIGIFAFVQSMQLNLPLLDCIAFLSSSIAVLIAALELEVKPDQIEESLPHTSYRSVKTI